MYRWIIGLALALTTCWAAGADVFYKRVEYKCDGGSCVGLFYSDRTATGRRPAVLLADEAGSTRSATKEHAAQIARLGYVVFTVDLYGDEDGLHEKGNRPVSVLAALTAPDQKLMRARADAAMKTLLKQSGVDTRQVAAVGFGIGGTAMIGLARTGVDLEGVVCVHGPVAKPLAEDKEKIQPTFLILAGADDPATPESQLKAFEEEMRQAKIECSISRFPGVGHQFDEASSAKAEAAITHYLAIEIPIKTTATPRTARADAPLPRGVPEKAARVLSYVDEHGEAMEGYEGGRNFGNFEHRLPANDRSGRRVKYREWDVNPHRPGVNRGVERLITGSDGTAWYTDDHYQTFKQIR